MIDKLSSAGVFCVMYLIGFIAFKYGYQSDFTTYIPSDFEVLVVVEVVVVVVVVVVFVVIVVVLGG